MMLLALVSSFNPEVYSRKSSQNKKINQNLTKQNPACNKFYDSFFNLKNT